MRVDANTTGIAAPDQQLDEARQYLEYYWPSQFDTSGFVEAAQAIRSVWNKSSIPDVGHLAQQTGLSATMVENAALFAFLADISSEMPMCDGHDLSVLLDIGGGPVACHHIFFSLRCDRIVHAEPSAVGRNEIEMFAANEPDSYDWDRYFQVARSLLPGEQPSRDAWKQRVRRALEGRTVACDALNSRLATAGRGADEILKSLGKADGDADIVSAIFVAESITFRHADFETVVRNIATTVKPGGQFVFTHIRNAAWYWSGERRVRSYPLDEAMLSATLDKFGLRPTTMRTISGGTAEITGYDGMIFVSGTRCP